MTLIAPRIGVDPEVRFGKPVIAGTRVPVSVIVGAVGCGLAGEGCDQDRRHGPGENHGGSAKLHRRVSRRESAGQTIGPSADRTVFGLPRCRCNHAGAITVRRKLRSFTTRRLQSNRIHALSELGPAKR